MKTNKIERSPEQELLNCNLAKTILMGLVVLYHSLCLWRAGGWFNQPPVVASNTLGMIADWLNSFHVYTFTLISGYIFYYLRYEKKKGYSEFKAFFLNKVKRLLVPYVFVSIFWVIPFQCYFFEVRVESIFENYILAVNPSQLWFLIMLFGVFVLFWFLSDYVREHDKRGLLILGVIYILGLIIGRVLPNIFQVVSICKHIFFFGLGFKIRQKKKTWLRKIPISILILGDVAIFYVVNYVGANNTNIFTKIVFLGGSIMLNIIGALMAFYALQYIADRWQGWKDKHIWSWLSQNCIIIYMLHQQLIYLSITWFNGKISNACLVLFNFCFSIVISSIIAWCIEKVTFRFKGSLR